VDAKNVYMSQVGTVPLSAFTNLQCAILLYLACKCKYKFQCKYEGGKDSSFIRFSLLIVYLGADRH